MITTTDIVEQVNKVKKEFITDGYSMSVGEIISMYKEKELIINPDFQRDFRWSLRQQSKLVESILIGVPLPSIFVYQDKDGRWEVVDGVQRISTILQFVGVLRDENEMLLTPTKLEGTKMLSSLNGMSWESLPLNPLQLDFKRSKLEVKIIKYLSDKNAKFEVFQRVNSGGTNLSAQEFRNCLLIMENKDFYNWMQELAEDNNFNRCIKLDDRWKDEKYHHELVLRLFIAVNYAYKHKNIDEYLDDALFYDKDCLLNMVKNNTFDLAKEKTSFLKIFQILTTVLEGNVLNKSGSGQMRESYYEAIVIGLYQNISDYELGNSDDVQFIENKIQNIEKEPLFLEGRKFGTAAGSRMAKLARFGADYFKK